jgi:hypothetical protein
VISTADELWVRTPAWCLKSGHPVPGCENDSAELFVKPDDRWDASDIADRRDDIVTLHYSLAEAFASAIKCHDRDQLPKLDDEMCNLLR